MRAVRFFFSRWQNWIGLLIVLTFTVVAISAPLLSPPDKDTQGSFKKVGRSTDRTPHPPDEISILGTVPGQIDVYHTLIWGAREALQFGLLVAIGAFVFGTLFGAIAGYFGGFINSLMMRIADAFLTFPVLAGVVFLQQLVAITIESMGGIYWFNLYYFGPVVDFQFTPPPFAVFLMKVDPILISLIIFSWMPIARIVNTMVITLKNADFIQAARALGGSPARIILRHLIPNAVGPAIVLAARDVGSSVIMQATITFIGLGGASAWGILLSIGRNWVIGPGGGLLRYWWVFLPVTIAIILFGVGWNLLGDGLLEVLDPAANAYGGKSLFRQKQKKVKNDAQPAKIPDPIRHSPNPDLALKTRGTLLTPMSNSAEKHPVLQAARDALAKKDFEHAVHAYSHLIKHRRNLNEIRQDMIDYARQFPNQPIIWNLLGNVLTQEGKHEYAEKAYEHARSLTQ